MKIEIALTVGAILTLSTIIYSGAFGMSMMEDQITICNFKDVCQLVNIDDYMTKESSAKLWNNFNNDLDTFDMKDITS